MIGGELGRRYAHGETIFREGDAGDAFYIIQFGHVRIVKATPAGETTMALLGPGEIFGEMSVLDGQPRSASAVVEREARILTLDKAKFFRSMTRDPTLAFKILQTMAQRIRRLDDEVAELKHLRASRSAQPAT